MYCGAVRLNGGNQKLNNITLYNCFSNNDEKHIDVEAEDDFLRVHIGDYLSLGEYDEELGKINRQEVKKMISISLLWNNIRQKINKGEYYIIYCGDAIYNVWLDGEEVKIDERIQKGEEVEEKILSFNMSSGKYWFSFLRHNSIGSTYYVENFNKSEEGIAGLNDEVFDAIYEFICHFDMVRDIENIVDFDFIKKILFEDFNYSLMKKYDLTCYDA